MLNPGEILNNRYRIDSKIGDGGSAQVFRALDLLLKRSVAVKILDTDFSDELASFKRFQIEAQAIAALDFPNIISIYDFGLLESEKSAFLVMPYIKGGALSTRLKTGKLSLEEVGLYLEQIAAALDYAHSNGILHRDVKPSNILMHSAHRVLLTDFGFAKITDDANKLTHTKALGTVDYISPEQIYGLVSSASDQYSLGIVLYQMLTGVLPFSGSLQDKLAGHIENPPPALATQPGMQHLPAEVINRLDKVIAKALSKSQNQRYPSCTAFSQAFQQAVQLGPMLEITNLAEAGRSPNQVASFIDKENALDEHNQVTKKNVKQPAYLVVLTNPEQGNKISFDLTEPEMKFGRSPDNELCVPLTLVSRHHATFYKINSEGGYRIADNNSRNGLIYKGRFFKEKVLENGDTIEIGKRGLSEYVVSLVYFAPLFQ